MLLTSSIIEFWPNDSTLSKFNSSLRLIIWFSISAVFYDKIDHCGPGLGINVGGGGQAREATFIDAESDHFYSPASGLVTNKPTTKMAASYFFLSYSKNIRVFGWSQLRRFPYPTFKLNFTQPELCYQITKVDSCVGPYLMN